jgi:Abortive infection C-terminus
LPEEVRTCRDLEHFWGRIKAVSPQWAPRRAHIRDGLAKLYDHLEGASRAPMDAIASEALSTFDADGVHVVWVKALERRHTDPEGAITVARTLLETVCKRILDESGIEYQDKHDLPKLYGIVATKLDIAPSQHTEDVFKRILGGCSSVVEGLGSLRNKISDAHGRGGKLPVRPLPRHAHLAVNLAGTMATFLVETWLARAKS